MTRTPTHTGLFRDLATGFRQQMFFWGKDVVHDSGNLLVSNGFEKLPSVGVQGTSRYSLPWAGGTIELYGSSAGWFGDGQAFVFIRPLGRCYRWLGDDLPVPGTWPREQLAGRADDDLHAAAVPFLNWWRHHEDLVSEQFGPDYRESCFRHFKRLPGSRSWLPPANATPWIVSLATDPQSTPRAKRWVDLLNTSL